MIDQVYKTCTRSLTSKDIDSIIAVLDSKSKISKVDKPDNKILEDHILKNITNDDCRVIGYFENNVLVSLLSQVISKRMSAWHMTMLGTNSNSVWNYKKNGLEYCWANAMDYAEQLNIYKIYWSLPSKWANTQRRTYQTTDVWYRYEIYTDNIIEPNCFPKWDDQKISFGVIPKPHEVTVKFAVLKNEFRIFGNKL